MDGLTSQNMMPVDGEGLGVGNVWRIGLKEEEL